MNKAHQLAVLNTWKSVASFKQQLLIVVSLLSLSAVLTAGLWPFHAPSNEVSWMRNRNGLLFGEYGTIFSPGTLNPENVEADESCSLEIWMQPALSEDSNTFLTFYNTEHPSQFSMHQSGSDLRLQKSERGLGSGGRRWNAGKVFQSDTHVFLTVTSDGKATSFYIDGTLRRTNRDFLLSQTDCTGQLIIGTAATQSDTWAGQLRGLAIYRGGLNPEEVYRHYETWIRNGRPKWASTEETVALFLFDERVGTVVHNQIHGGINLIIPPRYLVIHQAFFDPPWVEYYGGWGYWKNVLKNIVGFMPLGVFLYGSLERGRKTKSPVGITVLCAFLVSVTIEFLQGFLPTRQSGTTDLLTNTLGGYVGTILWRVARPRVSSLWRPQIRARGITR